MEETQRLSAAEFTNKILNGAAMGIVVGLIPSAVFGAVFNSLAQYGDIWVTLAQLVSNFSFSVSFLVGMFTALQFGLAPIHMAAVSAAAFIGSGAAQFTAEGWLLTGTGDLVNTILTVTVAVMLVRLYGDRLPNLTIVIVPILGGVLPGLVGQLTLPYIVNVTTMLGQFISHLTQLHALLMMVLISIAFAVVIITPLSSVALAYAISIAGLGAGAANVGAVATLFTLVYGSWRVNNHGTTFTLFFSGPKLFMPNVLQNPKVFIAIILNAAVTGFTSYLFQIQGTTASAGFGLTGLSGPLTALSFMEGSLLINIGILILQYLIIPLAMAILTHHLLTGMKLYTDDVFKFTGN